MFKKENEKISLKFHKLVIDVEHILHLHFMKGDWVVMNRQSTLHQPSMKGFLVVPLKIFKVFLALTKPLNANFDGNEINFYVPQNPMETTEVKELMATPLNIQSTKNGMPIICIVQDAIVSMYLMTKRKKQIEMSMFMLYLVDLDSLSRFNKIVSKLGYTGKTLLSFLLPRQLWHKMSKIRIENGISGSSLIKCIFDNYGAQRAAQYLLRYSQRKLIKLMKKKNGCSQ